MQSRGLGCRAWMRGCGELIGAGNRAAQVTAGSEAEAGAVGSNGEGQAVKVLGDRESG